MASVGFRGVDCRETGIAVVFRAFLLDSTGALLSSGTTSLYLMELQSDGSILTYDFADGTFKAGAVTQESSPMTYRPSNNGATDTGLWTLTVASTGFIAGAIYLARVHNVSASPVDQMREMQYGQAEGDLAVASDGSVGANVQQVNDVPVKGSGTSGDPWGPA